ncbi:probable cardiolipin synthase (CMP-forming) [Drosophila guanche]|uniref:cardiolipin synthase (CMP-forming) n=1 Tax=Drosophila guanche TaxID=7266 RepID=A0A3B0KWE4_DROGU|nr:probable cardiolipin synthase (CMP-forming) [Drosophila guanche]XP_034140284.1 probable cardiolipin synthase (CMP-forming) [Drosophila guanche]SPP89671.1 blast:Probable cardiolipin synthase [Drosophila guanche]
MLPAMVFRQGPHHGASTLEHVLGVGGSSFVNCLNRYAAATGFIRISFLDIKQRRNWDVARLRLYADAKKHSLHLRTLQGRDILQGVIDKQRAEFIERKNFLVDDIREARHKVQERVREKIVEIREERENIMTIPNMLTISRAILSPYIGYVIAQGDFTFGMSLLAIAGVSDLLDGQIARRWPSQATKAGSFLDPMADKLLMGSLVISLCYTDLMPIWLAGIIVFRDVFLLAAGFVIRYISLPPPKTFSRYFDATHVTAQLEPTLLSKINTGVQLATIGLSLGAPIWNYLDHPALHGLWYLTGLTTAATALSYVMNRHNTFKIIQKKT